MIFKSSFFSRLGHLRRHLKTLIFALFLSFIGSTVCVAQRIDEVYATALKNDQRFQSAVSRREAERESVAQAAAKLKPNISASSSRTRVSQERTDPNNKPLFLSYLSSGDSITLKQPILNIRSLHGLERSRLLQASSESNLELEKQELATRIVVAYNDLILSAAKLRVIEFERELRTLQRQFSEQSNSLGQVSRLEVLENQAQEHLQKTLIGQELGNRRFRESVFFQVTGLSKPRIYGFNKDFFDHVNFDVFAAELWAEKARRTNPKILALSAQILAQEKLLQEISADHLPTIDLVGQVARNSSDNAFFVSTETRIQAFGFQINVPIYSGGSVSSAQRQALSTLREREYELENIKLQLAADTENFSSLGNFALERAKALKFLIDAKKELENSVEKRVTLGLASRLDLIKSSLEVRKLEYELIEHQSQIVVNLTKLMAASATANAAFFADLAQMYQSEQN